MRRNLLEKKVKVVIATHKKYEMPTDDLYLPIHVGAELNKDKDLVYKNHNVG